MKFNRKIIERKKEISIALVLFAFLLLSSFPKVSWQINQTIESTFYRIAGQTSVDSNIVIIKITERDISALGGWPLKRSYYALLLNKLNKLNVKKIGIEIFLSPNSSSQEIYNSLLYNEIKKCKSVVLSAIVKGVVPNGNSYEAASVVMPEFSDSLSYKQIGHINFITNSGTKIPSVISVGEKNISSFSKLLADNANSKLLNLNFHSQFNSFSNYSLLEFLAGAENNPVLQKNLNGKIILIGVTDPTIGKSISTAFDKRLAGIGLHAFAIDNLINNKGLNGDYLFISGIVFLIILILLAFIRNNTLYSLILFFLLFVVSSYLLFINWFIQLNYSAFLIPIILLFTFELFALFISRKEELSIAFSENAILIRALEKKEEKLKTLEKELENLGEPNTELEEKIKRLKEEIKSIEKNHISDETPLTEKDFSGRKNFNGIIYSSNAMEQVVQIIKKIAPTDASVLIIGESGSGKELVAQAIHRLSNRNKKEMIAFNCAAISESLLESELFGHVKGAFTDASKNKIGKFEAADGSTIFLDEIGETSEKFQAKLLRVLQSGELQKVGSSETQKVDVRVIAATNKNLEKLVAEKQFREDLYYRLNVITINLPNLNDRKEDIPYLADYFASNENEIIKISASAMETLKENNWKGNVRELESTIKRASIFAQSDGRNIIQLRDLPKEMNKNVKIDLQKLILDSLREKSFSHSSISETAKELGNINRTIISENFRGIFFESYYKTNFDFDETVKIIANSENKEIIERVSKKGNTYLLNIKTDIQKANSTSIKEFRTKFTSKYKNLPQKYHFYLDKIVEHMI